MPRLFASQAEEVVNVRYTSSQTITIPPGVTKIDRMVGAGARGQDGTSGYYNPPTNHNTYAQSVAGYDFSSPNTFPGTLTWDQAQNAHQEAVNKLNNGGSGSWTRRGYEQYTNGFVVTNETMYYSNVVPGSASAYFSGGWKYSGNIAHPDFAFSYVQWQEYGSYVPGTPPSTGASSVFGSGTSAARSFPGSTGNVAVSPTTYTDVPITAGNYSLSIPSGGYIELTYTK